MNLMKKLAEEGQMPAANDPRPQRNPSMAAKTFRNGNETSSAMSTASSGVTNAENGTEYTSTSKYD